MSEKASYFKLGLFVIIGTALILTGVAVLGAGAFFKQTVTAETYMEESVQGLDVGAPVKHRGVQVGKVARIGFLGEEYDLPPGPDGRVNLLSSYVYIELELDIRPDGEDESIETFKRLIQAGLCARLASTGLVGNVYVDLFFPAEAPTSPKIVWEPRSLYIPSTRSVIGELTATASRLAKQLEDAKLDVIAQDIARLVKTVEDKVAGVDIGRLQQDMVTFVEELRESNRRVQEILSNPNIDSTLTSVAEASATIRRIAGESEGDLATFIKDLPEVSARLKNSAVEIEKFLRDERTSNILTDAVQAAELAPETLAEVRRVAHRLGSLIAAQQADLAAIITQLRKASDNLERFSAEAAANPSRVLFGEPPPPLNRPAGSETTGADKTSEKRK